MEDKTYDTVTLDEKTAEEKTDGFSYTIPPYSDEEEPAVIPFFVHESAMMHKDRDNERMRSVVIAICITFVVTIVIFVTGYTIRTRNWLDTITQMNKTIAEVTNAKGENNTP